MVRILYGGSNPEDIYVIDFTVNATVMEEDVELKTRCEFMVFL